MAHILPQTPPLRFPQEILRVFESLKSLPDSYFIWHHLAPWQPDAPDFLVITRQAQALLIKVSSANHNQMSVAAQLRLIEDHSPPPGIVEETVLINFRRSLNLDEKVPVGLLVVFPNISQSQLDAGRPASSAAEVKWAGREILKAEGKAGWIQFFPQQSLSPAQIQILRERFTPEIVVPAELTIRQQDPRQLEAGLTSFLLDYNQESVLKSDLELPEANEALTRDFRVNIINGVAGSGKTLILLYRLRLLYHLYPNRQFLMLTHNRPLNHDLQNRFYRLEGKQPGNIEWATFTHWCYQLWKNSRVPWTDPLPHHKRTHLLERVWEERLANSSIPLHLFISEVDWIKDQLPMSLEDYLHIDRRGRGFALNSEQRHLVWQAFLLYQSLLEKQRTIDWSEVPRRVWQWSQESQINLPQYDFILVDEAQFFAPLWFDLIRKALRKPVAHLCLAADPTQGFLGRRTSWKSLGIEARGRTHHLVRSYRTTREILNFATLFYRLRCADSPEEEILYPDLTQMPTGVIPQLLVLNNPQDEITRVANEIAALLEQGIPRQHILILHSQGEGVQRLISAINRKAGKDAAMNPKDTYPGNYVRVTTLNAGAGLESPIVFLCGLRELFEEEQSLRLSDVEREEIIRSNTRKVYMAATRAGQRLVLTYVGELPAALQQAINAGYSTH
ncbi:MAG: UvrD-helicase domain-containing protein [Chloroflexota bacterium]